MKELVGQHGGKTKEQNEETDHSTHVTRLTLDKAADKKEMTKTDTKEKTPEESPQEDENPEVCTYTCDPPVTPLSLRVQLDSQDLSTRGESGKAELSASRSVTSGD